MPVMDGDGLMAGEVPLPVAAGTGLPMSIELPGVRSWCTATHQFHTSSCTGPATYPIIRPSFPPIRIDGTAAGLAVTRLAVTGLAVTRLARRRGKLVN